MRNYYLEDKREIRGANRVKEYLKKKTKYFIHGFNPHLWYHIFRLHKTDLGLSRFFFTSYTCVLNLSLNLTRLS